MKNKTKQPLAKRLTACFLLLLTVLTLFGCAGSGEWMNARATDTDPQMDFSSCRLVLSTEDADVIRDGDTLLGSYGSIHLLSFETAEETEAAYDYYKDKVDAVEPDATVVGAEGETDVPEPIPMTEEANPMALLDEMEASTEVQKSHGVIALIDTGVAEQEGVIDRVSVLDEALEGGTHGQQMLDAIKSQDANAQVLSIRAMNDEGLGTISSLVSAMEYAIEQKVDYINLSVYAKMTLSTSVLEQEIVKATDNGIVVIGAAGNDGADVAGYMPGSVKEAYIIGAAKEDGTRLETSNYGKTVDYNVVAGSTSQAAALFTGYISANGLASVEDVLDQGLIYTPNFTVTPEEPDTEKPDTEKPDTEKPDTEKPDTEKPEESVNYEITSDRQVAVKYLFVDSSWATPDMTIADVYDKFYEAPDENGILGTVTDQYADVYTDGNGNYQVHADVPLKAKAVDGDSYYHADFAQGNNTGTAITDGVSFDLSTGIATIRESAFYHPDDSVFADLQIQVLVPVKQDFQMTQTIQVENADGSVDKMMAQMDPFGQETITLAVEGLEKELTSEDFAITVNGNRTPVDGTWDNASKTLTLNVSSAMVHTVNIKILTTTDALFQVAKNQGPGATPMFFLPDGTDVSKLKTRPTVSANSALGAVGYEGSSAVPDYVIGNASMFIPDRDNGEEYDYEAGEILGYIGIPKNLFGINFDAQRKNGTSYGHWVATKSNGIGDPALPEAQNEQRNMNAGIAMACVHAVSGSAPLNHGKNMTVTYKITNYWAWTDPSSSDVYTCFAMTILGQDRINASNQGQTVGASIVFAVKDSMGGLSIQKVSEEPSITNGNKNYSLKGAVYGIYSDKNCTKEVQWKDASGTLRYRITTDSKGYAATATKALKKGTYYLKEISPSPGYFLDTKVHTVSVEPNKITACTSKSEEPPKYGRAMLHKISDNPDMTTDNGCYTLEGATYGLYTDEACTHLYTNDLFNGYSKTVFLDGDETEGIAMFDHLAFGTYWIKEVAPPTGYHINPTPIRVEVTEANSGLSGVVKEREPHYQEKTQIEPAKNDPAGIEMTKIWDGPETATIPTLEGTQFTVKYFDKLGMTKEDALTETPTRTWVLEIQWNDVTNKYITGLVDDYLVEELSDDFYRDESGEPILPRGTISIQETKPAPGYTLEGYLMDEYGTTIATDSEIYISSVEDPDGGDQPVWLQGGNVYEGHNVPIVGSITLKKVDSDGKSPLEGVTFRCVGQTVPDVYTATTDENGEVVFDNLYPDVYTITEIGTVNGHELLPEPLVVEVPMRVTAEYIEQFDVDEDSVIFDPNGGEDGREGDGIYYIHSFTYEISNHISLEAPMTGGITGWKVFVPMAAGLGILGGLGLYLGRRRKHS